MANSRTETGRHSGRVAHLATHVAEKMGLDRACRAYIQEAALLHQNFRLTRFRSEPVVPGPAADILRLFAGGEPANEPMWVEAGAAILQVCDAFDEAIEFAVYEGRPASEAIREFFTESGRLHLAVAGHLRELAAPATVVLERGRLPVLPAAASALVRISPDAVSAAELAATAERDPVLASRLLGLANSAAFGATIEIRSVRDAVLRLGVPFAHKALMAAALGPLFASAGLRAIWKRARETAAIACDLALRCEMDSNQAWLAGLLHNIGRLLFETGPAALCARERDWRQAGFPLTYAELMVWGQDYASAGAELAKRWNLPEFLIEAIRGHAAPELECSRLSALVYVAARSAEPLETDEIAGSFRMAKALQAAELPDSIFDLIERDTPVFALAS